MARRADREFAIRTTGLGALNRSLNRISRESRRQSVGRLREIARRVRGTAQSKAPVQTGRLRGSLRYSASNRGAAITSTLPYAPVHEYGGTISPRGAPITIPERRFVGRAIQQDARRIEEQVGDLLDGIARRNGFR